MNLVLLFIGYNHNCWGSQLALTNKSRRYNFSITRAELVSISSTFYACIFHTKVSFWHQNFVQKRFAQLCNFWRENYVKKARVKCWWNWHLVGNPKFSLRHKKWVRVMIHFGEKDTQKLSVRMCVTLLQKNNN